MDLMGRKRAERELDEEFRFHLEKHMEAGLARGLTPEEARAAAIAALDGVERRKEECRDQRVMAAFDGMAQDVRYALRVLRKSPAFTAVAVLSLALGVGANTAIFSVMDVLLLRPLGVAQPAQLQVVTLQGKNPVPRHSFSYPLFEMIRDRNAAFALTFAWGVTRFQTPSGGEMILMPAVTASGDYFSGFGVAPVLGRVFGREEDQKSGAKPVAVISDGLWQRRYHRDRGVLGQTIVLNAVATTVIGVMPAGFFGGEVGTAPEVWVPLNLSRQTGDNACISSPNCWYLRAMGRLKPGVSEAQGQANLRSISRRVLEDDNPPQRADRRAEFLAQTISTEPGLTGYTGLRTRVRAPLQVLMGLVGFVLLIACANMANLLTARASARQREVAVRLAMGAGRARVVRQFLTESVLLAAGGAAGGFVIAIAATRALISILSTVENPIMLDLRPDWRVLAFTAAAAMATAILFGLGPALRATRTGVGAALKERTHQIQSGGMGFTRVVLGVQVALSVILLAAAGLLAGSLVRLVSESPGFDPHGLTVVDIDTTKLGLKGPGMIDLYGKILQRERELPGVGSASMMSVTQLCNCGWDQFVGIPGRPDIPEKDRDADINAVGPRYIETMRIPLLAGRDFNDSDTAQSMKVGIISENASRRWFPHGAVGADIEMGKGDAIRIVGVTGNVKYLNLRDDLPVTLYLPYTQWNQGGHFVMRTNAPMRQTWAAFRDMLHQVAPGAPIRSMKTMDQQLEDSISTERLTAYLSVFFAALALLLTAVGLYGILAYSVARRTSEIGVRMALGAQRENVVWLVVREAMGQTVAGAMAGIAAVTAFSRVLVSLLYGVKPNDPSVMMLSIATLAAVCAAAAWIPARRASRLDPMAALREE